MSTIKRQEINFMAKSKSLLKRLTFSLYFKHFLSSIEVFVLETKTNHFSRFQLLALSIYCQADYRISPEN